VVSSEPELPGPSSSGPNANPSLGPGGDPCNVDPNSAQCHRAQFCSAIEADYLGGIHVTAIADLRPVQLAFLNSVLATNDCPPVGNAPRLPTGEEITRAVTRVAPLPVTVSGGDKYLVNAAVVFSARGPGGQSLSDVRLINIKLLGYTIQAQLHLVKTVWAWGDGSSDTFAEDTHQDLVGQKYTDAIPCESATVCSKYISHVFSRVGSDTIAVTAYWTATVTIDGSAIVIPVTGAVSRGGDGKAIALVQARSVLVNH
jgi:hypothetical protein